jgi:hypothetical protein
LAKPARCRDFRGLGAADDELLLNEAREAVLAVSLNSERDKDGQQWLRTSAIALILNACEQGCATVKPL